MAGRQNIMVGGGVHDILYIQLGGGKGNTTDYTELQPLLSGVHSVMRVKSQRTYLGSSNTKTVLFIIK